MFTSNIFAILGLRSLYFVLADAMSRFEKLKYGLAVLFVFVGSKMILHDHVHVPNLVSLSIILAILAILAVSIGGSLWSTRSPQKEPS